MGVGVLERREVTSDPGAWLLCSVDGISLDDIGIADGAVEPLDPLLPTAESIAAAPTFLACAPVLTPATLSLSIDKLSFLLARVF